MSDGWDLTDVPRPLWPYVRDIDSSNARVASSMLASLLALKQVASGLEGESGKQLSEAVSTAATRIEDEYCGTPPHPHRGLAVAQDLASFAHALPATSAIRRDALEMAEGVAQRALIAR